MTIGGEVAPGFERVRDAFSKNFSRTEEPIERGPGLAVYHRGRQVVDLWGGFADAAGTRPWTENTYANV